MKHCAFWFSIIISRTGTIFYSINSSWQELHNWVAIHLKVPANESFILTAELKCYYIFNLLRKVEDMSRRWGKGSLVQISILKPQQFISVHVSELLLEFNFS